MTEENKKDCACNEHMSSKCEYDHMKHKMMKKILVLIVVVMAFGLGMQLGELKGELRGGSHERRGMMNQSHNSGYQGYRMMNIDQATTKGIPAQTAPTAVPAKQ